MKYRQIYENSLLKLKNNWQNPPLAFLIGLIVSFVGMYTYQNLDKVTLSFAKNENIYADFAVYINDERLELEAFEQLSHPKKATYQSAWLEDGGNVVHLYAPGVSFVEFLSTIGIEMSKTCLTIDSDNYCEDNRHILELYANYHVIENIYDYVPKTGDQIMVYYGVIDNIKINKFLKSVTSEACVHSGKCLLLEQS